MTIWSTEIKELEKLYQTFIGQHPKLDNELERLIKTDDENIALVYSRRCLEVMITDLCETELNRGRGTEPLRGIIDKLNKEEKVPHNIIVSMQNLNSLSTFGAHPKDFDPRQVKPVLLDLITVLEWYLKHLDSRASDQADPDQQQVAPTESTLPKKDPHKSRKKVIFIFGGLVICAIIVISLIVFDVIGTGKKSLKDSIGSIVVLPFANYTGDDQLDILISGLHSALVGDLGKIGSLRTIGSTSSKIYKDVDMSATQIASELNVEAVIELDVVCLGEDTICLQTRLISTGEDEKQLWVGDFKEAKNKIPNLYNQVIKQIADQVEITLTPEEENLLSISKIVNPEAYEAYLKGKYYWDLFTPEALQLALEHFNKAIELDDTWALPYAGIAYYWVAVRQFSLAPSSVTIPNIYKNLNKAIELDPNSSFVHYVNALVALATEFDWKKSEELFLKVLEINPNDAFGHMYYAHLLLSLMRTDEALLHCKIALELDPWNPMIQSLSIIVLADAGQYEEAILMAEKVLSVVPDHPVPKGNLMCLYAIMGDFRKSIKLWSEFFEFSEEIQISILNTFDQQGLDASMKAFIEALETATGDQFPMDLAQAYTVVRDEAKALYWYEKAYEELNPMMIYITTLYSTRGPFEIKDPGFDSLLIKMNLPLK